jgi:hypothetical protein
MSFGNTQNSTSREINDAQYQARRRGPSEKQNALWHQQWLTSGAQYRMSFPEYRKQQLKEYNKARRIKAQQRKRKTR